MSPTTPPFSTNTGSDISQIMKYHESIANDIVEKVKPYWDFNKLDEELSHNLIKLLPLRLWPHADFAKKNIRHLSSHALFQTWVLIAIYYENKHIAEMLELKEGYSAAFAAQHLTPQIMYFVASQVVRTMGVDAVLEQLKAKGIDLFYPIKDLSLTDDEVRSLLPLLFDGQININAVDLPTREILWNWCIVLIELKPTTWVMMVIDFAVKNILTDISAVSRWFATGEYLHVGCFLDMYVEKIMKSYLESYFNADGTNMAGALENLNQGFSLSLDAFSLVFNEQRAIYRQTYGLLQAA